MQTFELYGLAWFVYLLLGAGLLFLVYIKIKNWQWNKMVALLSFLAVGAFTPATVLNAETYAPLVITAILNAETEGVSAIISGLVRLVIIWGIIFFSSMGIRHFWLTKSKSTDQASDENSKTS